MSASSKRAGRLGLALGLGSALAASACLAPDPEAQTTIVGPSRETFGLVSAVLERRCGTLDCHGDGARPMRIYGQAGLREPDPDPDEVTNLGEYTTGGEVATTTGEITANYRSVCGLEPELLGEVVTAQSEPTTLTLVRKPRLLEAHKGGRVWAEGGDGDACLIAWLTQAPDDEACLRELAHR